MLLLRPGRSLPRGPFADMELGLVEEERIPKKSSQIHPAICPALPVLATLLPGAESPSLDDHGPHQESYPLDSRRTRSRLPFVHSTNQV